MFPVSNSPAQGDPVEKNDKVVSYRLQGNVRLCSKVSHTTEPKQGAFSIHDELKDVCAENKGIIEEIWLSEDKFMMSQLSDKEAFSIRVPFLRAHRDCMEQNWLNRLLFTSSAIAAPLLYQCAYRHTFCAHRDIHLISQH